MEIVIGLKKKYGLDDQTLYKNIKNFCDKKILFKFLKIEKVIISIMVFGTMGILFDSIMIALTKLLSHFMIIKNMLNKYSSLELE